MKQFLFGCLASALLTGSAIADEASLKKAIQAAYPKVRVESVTKTPFAGLYEAYIDGKIIYTDEKFKFLITDGRLIDTKSRKDLTGERMEELSRVDFNSLPLDQAIKVVRGNGSRKLVVFADPDCPYCKRLEQNELVWLNDLTVYTFLYPLDELHPDARSKAKAIWCAADRAKAWQDWVQNNQLPPAGAACDTPVEKNLELGRKLGVNSTPTLYFTDGRRMLGAYPAKEIDKMLGGGPKN